MTTITNPNSILIIRLSSMGDIVVLTPIFRSFREKYPSARIDFLTKKDFAEIVANNPFLSNIIAYDSSTGLAGWRELCQKLAAQDYDLLIDMHNNIRSHILSHYLRRVSLLRYHKPYLRRFLLFYLWLNLFPPDFRLLKEYFKVLQSLGINYPPDARPEIFLKPEAITKARDILAKYEISEPFVTILPIANWPNKLFPLEKYIKVARRINTDLQMPVLWLGGKGDIHLQQLDYLVPGKSVRLAGETTLSESLALISLSRAVIGSDTGLTYAAEALGKPVVLILGPTSQETGAGCYAPKSTVLEAQLFCRPCSQKGDRRCYRRRRQLCFDQITDGQVFEALEKIIGVAS
ncbi:MAG TPA: glycosyltransferase family 9 protein [Candidatus Marinimicrobia bacterium]|nr:glycosyltransferase family 9 protein [Candidatus Neomarinimicrobiota bacterium]HRS50932.1 glycosyltransferase family 9 protein [Candidatus Neomarinimicrobiota bacterium]HRU91726.1 glycosyltransferase family 9 protein [Candidatus Neomarinimicrobiota bacterium]